MENGIRKIIKNIVNFMKIIRGYAFSSFKTGAKGIEEVAKRLKDRLEHLPEFGGGKICYNDKGFEITGCPRGNRITGVLIADNLDLHLHNPAMNLVWYEEFDGAAKIIGKYVSEMNKLQT